MNKERVVTFGVQVSCFGKQTDVVFSMEELERLVDTAGGEVVRSFMQTRNGYTPQFLIGRGKIEEIVRFCEEEEIDVIISDDPLSSAQQKNIENLTDIKVIDRTRLILDIFAKRARTREGKLQVELAQLEYLLPRLTGKGKSLSQQKGGIGTRGPGERKLEMDRRKIRDRIAALKREIEHVKTTRSVQRKKRQNVPIPLIALVGYTNAGKSTLMNKLTKAHVFVENKLFATLDPTIRIFNFSGGQKIVLADTVGFIQKLPHELIASFRATLEEVKQADIILHLIDITLKNYEIQTRAVVTVLNEIGVKNVPIVTVYNKSDMVTDKIKQTIMRREKDAYVISAYNGEGLDSMLSGITKLLQKRMVFAKLAIPYSSSKYVNVIHEVGVVHIKRYLPDFIEIEANIDVKTYKKVKQFVKK